MSCLCFCSPLPKQQVVDGYGWMDGVDGSFRAQQSFTVRCEIANPCLLIVMVVESSENQAILTFVYVLL